MTLHTQTTTARRLEAELRQMRSSALAVALLSVAVAVALIALIGGGWPAVLLAALAVATAALAGTAVASAQLRADAPYWR